jgi:hypothetical protein
MVAVGPWTTSVVSCSSAVSSSSSSASSDDELLSSRTSVARRVPSSAFENTVYQYQEYVVPAS